MFLSKITEEFISVVPECSSSLMVVCMAFNTRVGVSWSSGVMVLLSRRACRASLSSS